MKNKITLLTIGGIIFSYLFYEQNLGINALLFSIALITFMAMQYPAFLKNKYAPFCAAGALIAGFFIYWNNSTVSYYAYFISLFGLMAFKNEGSFTLLNYALTYVINLICMPLAFFNNVNNNATEINNTQDAVAYNAYEKFKKIIGYLIVVFIIIIFFFIYQTANPLFYQFTKNLSLFNINYGFIFFCLLGMMLLFPLFYNTIIKTFFDFEAEQNTTINPENFPTAMIEKHKLHTIFFLFIALNIMLVVINLLDVNYLYLSHTMPKGITQAQFVHNGVGTLIFSIVLGASIICFLFKGDLNFIKENKTIKLLVYAWILQNIFMVISTMLRNNIYVFNSGLTGKRIGVYYYLFFTIIGLLFTAYKIYKHKTVYFLYATNTWIWYGILLLSCSVNWENIIFKNQLQKYNANKILDFEYATRFNKTNLPELITLFNVGKNENIDLKNSNNIYSLCRDYDNLKKKVERDLLTFLLEQDEKGWQSHNKLNKETFSKLLKMNQQNQLHKLTLYNGISNESETPIKAIACVSNLNTLIILDNYVDFKNLTLLKNVEKIVWLGTDLNKLKYFKTMKNLKELKLPNIIEPSDDYFIDILPNVKVIQQHQNK